MASFSQDIVGDCYLCGKKLGSTSTPDHIIPDKLFRKNDQDRPKLLVHQKCNNLKSKEDQWFIKQLQLRSSFNPEAEQEFSHMMDKAISEQPDAYVVGKKLRHYKLARRIFNKVVWGLELKHRGQSFMQMELDKTGMVRFQRYVETMCRGLFICNVLSSKPPIPELIMRQYAYLELKGKKATFINAIKNLIDMSGNSKFGRRWGDRVFYIGSRVRETPDKGFLFIQFYEQLGILALFKGFKRSLPGGF